MNRNETGQKKIFKFNWLYANHYFVFISFFAPIRKKGLSDFKFQFRAKESLINQSDSRNHI